MAHDGGLANSGQEAGQWLGSQVKSLVSGGEGSVQHLVAEWEKQCEGVAEVSDDLTVWLSQQQRPLPGEDIL